MKEKIFYNLTSPQKSIWQTNEFYKGTSIENISGRATILEKIDFKKFEKAINLFIKKNDSFRLKFVIENNEVKQYVESFSEFSFEKVLVSSEKNVKKIEKELSNYVFETTDSYLFKFVLYEFPDGHGGFVITMHHLISDAWTSGIVISEIINLYDALKANEEISNENAPSYVEYIKSEKEYINSDKFKKDKEFWNGLFETVPEIATIPSFSPNSLSCKARRKQFVLNKNLMDVIHDFCIAHKVSEFNFFMGVLSIYLGRVSSLDEFVIGTPILNRSNFKEKHTAGMFISVVPFKISLEDCSFIEFVSKISKDFFNIFRHQKYPYQTLLEDIRKEHGNNIPNLYNVMFSYQNMRSNKQTAKTNYESTWLFCNNISDDLEVHLYDINDTGNILMAYDFKVDKYKIDDIYAMHARILNIINQILENDEINLNDIEIVTPDEKNEILYKFNNTKMDYPSDKTITELFEEQAKKTPDNIAVVFENQSLTYKELNEKANSLANYLLYNGSKPNDVISIFLEKSIEIVVAMLGILKAHCTFLPLDIDYPKERISYMLKDSNCKFMLSLKKFHTLLNLNGIKFIDISLDNSNIYSKNFEQNNINMPSFSPEDIIYIIYTSGSTGMPKGVEVKHRNIVRLVLNQNFITFSEHENMVQTGTIAFDACIFEIFGALLHGFKLHIISKKTLLDINAFKDFLVKNKITVLFLTTGLFNELGNVNPSIFSTLHYLLTGGDVISVSAVKNILSANPNLNLVNCYGPTENGSYSTCFNIPADWAQSYVPIGKPIANSTAYIVSKCGKLQPFGVPGELWVGGDGLAKGYVNNAELTNQKFVKSSFNDEVLYKTGDLAQYDDFGNICFLGRIDNQVKLRGFRIELGEIDSSVLHFEHIKESLSIIQNHNDSPRIYTYITADCPIDVQNLKKYLSRTLPTFMIPSVIMQLDKFPINLNGKIDRNQLPFIGSSDASKTIVPPRNSIDLELIKMLKNILGICQISINDSFFEIGGDSLSAMNLCNQIFSTLGVQLFVKDIFEHPTIIEISDIISNALHDFHNEYIDVSKSKESEYYPASSAQKRIFLSSSMSGNDSILYNISGGIILDGDVDIKKLEKSLNTLINRHESLRTYFELNNGTVVQKILNKISFNLDFENDVDFSNLDSIFKDFVKPFNLSEAPLFRTKFIKFTNGKSSLLIDMHHIISDGTSLSIFTNELCSLYNGSSLPELSITYKDFAISENEKLSSGALQDAENYWIKQFSDEVPLLNLPTNHPRPSIRSFKGEKVYSVLDASTTYKINILAKNLGVTPYMLLLAAYYILLKKYTSQDDIVVGSPVIGRDSANIYNVIGMFVNTLAIRSNVDSNLSFKEFVISLKDNLLNAYKYQSYPFDELVRKLNIPRDTSRNPLFDVMFVYQNNGNPEIKLNGLNSKFYIPDTKTSKFDLSLEIVPENDSLSLSFEYATDLFNKEFIKNLSNHYINIINSILENNGIKISEINMLSKSEQDKILYEFNNTKMDYPKDKTVSELFEEQVEKTPNNIAVVFEDKELTYKELNEKSNSLALYLRNSGISRNDIVGIMVNRSLEMIISILAVLKAGGAYIPIDPEYPEDRIKYMLDNSNAKLLLTQEKLRDNIEFENKICVDLSIDDIYKQNFNNLANINNAEDLSYIIYTSGSTGVPKGVSLKHKSLSNLTFYLNNYVEFLKETNIQKSVVSVTTVSFDIFVFETLICLQKGLRIVIANEEEQHIPSALVELIKKEKIEILQMTPSRMQILVNNISANNLSSIKYAILAGEPLPDALLMNLVRLGIKKVYNGYGPSETTVFSTFTDVTTYSKVNIGKPLYNTLVYILNKDMNPCPVNVPGELYISGDGLAKGYLNNESLNNNLFVKNPFIQGTRMYKTGDLCKFLPNGEIEYIERIDNQIKIRGLRIELGEIESKMLTYPNIKNACVIKQSINNRDFISAYFTSNKRINISELRKYLSKYLPKYMVPSYFTVLEEFPYTPNGKINKKILPLPKEILKTDNQAEYIAPRTTLEKKFVNAWEKVLNIKPIGITDNFFELGGDSILAMNLNIELKNITDSISYSDIFKFPTISELIKKSKSKDKEYDFNYMEKNYDKYTNLLNLNLNVPKRFSLKYKPCGNILLTGATGFLGMHILDSFLKNDTGNIYCLIREEPGLTAQTKLHQKLTYYFGNKYDKLIGNRIFAVTGKITESGFGLNQDDLLSLANNVDIVINTAARVAHYGNYSDFYNTNVASVKNMIDFCKSFNKKLYHISTLSVSGNVLDSSSIKQNITNTTYFAENNLYIGQSLENVYVRSKFEAECLILDSILGGLDAFILRVGNLMPRLKDGKFQENINDNAFINRISAFIALGTIPDYLEKEYLEFTPIDITANAIIQLITHPNSNNRIFHLFNHNHIYINKCMKYFKMLNPDFKISSEPEFKKLIKSMLNNKKKKEILNSLINDLDSDLHLAYKTDIIIKSEITIKYLSKIGFSWPKISSKYIIKFIELLRRNL